MTFRIFVYGTLKRGLGNAFYLAEQRFVSKARTLPVYRMVDCGGYPGMYPVKGKGMSIEGEIWEVNEECLAQLDLLEDVAGGEYGRVMMQLEAPYDEAGVEGYLYLRDVSSFPDAGNNWGSGRSEDS